MPETGPGPMEDEKALLCFEPLLAKALGMVLAT